MQKLLLFNLVLITINAVSQDKIESTNQISVEGKVKHKISYSLRDLSAFKTIHIDSIVIYSHLMEPRKTIRHIKGVLLKHIIDKAVIDSESPKVLSEFYISCIASDNYKVVLSWNELYNSNIGESIIIITEADGKKAEQLTDRMAMLSAADRATGRRYVKGLKKIVIERVK